MAEFFKLTEERPSVVTLHCVTTSTHVVKVPAFLLKLLLAALTTSSVTKLSQLPVYANNFKITFIENKICRSKK